MRKIMLATTILALHTLSISGPAMGANADDVSPEVSQYELKKLDPNTMLDMTLTGIPVPHECENPRVSVQPNELPTRSDLGTVIIACGNRAHSYTLHLK